MRSGVRRDQACDAIRRATRSGVRREQTASETLLAWHRMRSALPRVASAHASLRAALSVDTRGWSEDALASSVKSWRWQRMYVMSCGHACVPWAQTTRSAVLPPYSWSPVEIDRLRLRTAVWSHPRPVRRLQDPDAAMVWARLDLHGLACSWFRMLQHALRSEHARTIVVSESVRLWVRSARLRVCDCVRFELTRRPFRL